MISSITGMRPDQRKSPNIGPPTTDVAQMRLQLSLRLQGRAERAARRWRDLSARKHNRARRPDAVRGREAGGRDAPAVNRRVVRPLRLCTFGARRAASRRQPRAPARTSSRRNDQYQVHELQERAILPALQSEAGEDHAQERCASHVMAYGHSCA